MPSYQKKAVESYLKNNKALYGPFTPFFNAKNRGFPDVAGERATPSMGVFNFTHSTTYIYIYIYILTRL